MIGSSQLPIFDCRLPIYKTFGFVNDAQLRKNRQSEIGNGSGHTGDVNVNPRSFTASLLSNYREI